MTAGRAMLERMIDERPQADRIFTAQLHGEAEHHARWRELSEAEHAAAVAELRELAGGRGVTCWPTSAGFSRAGARAQLNEPLARQAAQLCRAAGADLEAIPAWVAEGGGARRAAASTPPPSGGLHGGGARPAYRLK